jgi:hypothetical protein
MEDASPMNRFAYPTFIIAAALLTGCAAGAPSEDSDSVPTVQTEGLTSLDRGFDDDDDDCDDDDHVRNKANYKLTLSSVAPSQNLPDNPVVLSGTRRNGGEVSAAFNAATIFKTARLNSFTPTDPCRTLAAQYNASLSGSVDIPTTSVLGAYAAQGCRARVAINLNTGAIIKFKAIR